MYELLQHLILPKLQFGESETTAFKHTCIGKLQNHLTPHLHELPKQQKYLLPYRLTFGSAIAEYKR